MLVLTHCNRLHTLPSEAAFCNRAAADPPGGSRLLKARSNIKDVARRVGVHPSTVSRVLNPATRSMVSEALAKDILRIAAELGYRRNPLASGLRTRKTFTVGIIIPDLTKNQSL